MELYNKKTTGKYYITASGHYGNIEDDPIREFDGSWLTDDNWRILGELPDVARIVYIKQLELAKMFRADSEAGQEARQRVAELEGAE